MSFFNISRPQDPKKAVNKALTLQKKIDTLHRLIEFKNPVKKTDREFYNNYKNQYSKLVPTLHDNNIEKKLNLIKNILDRNK